MTNGSATGENTSTSVYNVYGLGLPAEESVKAQGCVITEEDCTTKHASNCSQSGVFGDVRHTSKHVSDTFGDVNATRFFAKKAKNTTHRYVLDALNATQSQYLAIKSDMKTGKTTATADLIRNAPTGSKVIIVIATATLCQSTAHTLSGKSGKLVANYQGLTNSKVDAVVTTFNSLPKVSKLFEHATIHALVFDESEQGAQFMANGTITNKSQAARAIKDLSGRANRVLLLDAHLGANSSTFAGAFMPACPFDLLHNQYAPWEGWTHTVLDGKKQGIAKIIERLDAGERLWITSSSAELLRSLHTALDKLGHLNGLRALAAYPSKTEDESQEFSAAKKDNELFKNYDVVFSSPAGGVGLSIEGEHFHRTICFAVRDKDTPDATSTLQYPFRVRDAIDKHIDMVYIDQSGRGVPELSEAIAQDVKTLAKLNRQILEHVVSDYERREIMAVVAELHGTYEANIAAERSTEFDNYIEIISAEFKAKGIRLVSAPTLSEHPDIDIAIREAKEGFEEQKTEALIAAEVIDSDQAETLRTLKRANLKMSSADTFALKKYNLMESYHFEDAEPTSDQLREYIELQNSGIATGRNRIVSGSIEKPDAKRIATAYAVGVGDNELFVRDAAGMPSAVFTARWRVERILNRILGIKRVGDVYSFNADAEITAKWLLSRGSWNSKTSVVSELMKAVDEYNATKPAKRISKKQLYAHPDEAIRNLLADSHKIKTSKVRNQSAFTIDAKQPVIDNLNSKLARGSFGVLKMLDRINAIELLKSGDTSEALRDTLSLHEDDATFISENLQRLSRRMQNNAVVEYLRLAMKPHDGGRMQPIALANTYLREFVQLHGTA